MSYGVTPTGFRRKTYLEIRTEMEEQARSLFGASINLSATGVLGLFVRLYSWGLNILWQVFEKTYYSLFIDSAEGTSLDKLALFGAITRRPAQSAIVTLSISGDNAVVVPVGFTAQTAQEIRFSTINEVTIEGGSATVQAVCEFPGVQGNVPSGAVNEIFTPIAGIESVTNPDDARGGSSQESDSELRTRYIDSIQLGQGSTRSAVFAELSNIASVDRAYVYENSTNTEDGDGRPAHSIECIVLGGEASEIANAIYRRKPAGIETFGEQSHSILDANGDLHVIRFNRPTEVDVWVKYFLTVNQAWNSGQIAALKDLAVREIGGQTSDLVYRNGLNMGDDVLTWRLVAVAGGLSGIEAITVLVGFDDDPLEDEKLDISVRQLARTSPDKIVVEIAE